MPSRSSSVRRGSKSNVPHPKAPVKTSRKARVSAKPVKRQKKDPPAGSVAGKPSSRKAALPGKPKTSAPKAARSQKKEVISSEAAKSRRKKVAAGSLKRTPASPRRVRPRASVEQIEMPLNEEVSPAPVSGPIELERRHPGYVPESEDYPGDAAISRIIKEAERALEECQTGSTGSFAQYLRELARYPVLTPAKEYAIAVAAVHGHEDARSALVRHNLRFVVAIARRVGSRQQVPLEDLVQEGNAGLMKAAKKFDPSKGVKFVSYAVWWIRQAIRAAIVTQKGTVRVPVGRGVQMAQIHRARNELAGRLHRDPTVEEISEFADLPLSEVLSLMAVSQGEFSFDAPPPSDGQGGGLEDKVGIDGSAESDMERDCRDQQIRRALAKLGRPRDAQVLTLAFGLDGHGEHTLEEIGGMLDITRERVRQIRDRALRRLRQSGDDALKEYWGVSLQDD